MFNRRRRTYRRPMRSGYGRRPSFRRSYGRPMYRSRYRSYRPARRRYYMAGSRY